MAFNTTVKSFLNGELGEDVGKDLREHSSYKLWYYIAEGGYSISLIPSQYRTKELVLVCIEKKYFKGIKTHIPSHLHEDEDIMKKLAFMYLSKGY